MELINQHTKKIMEECKIRARDAGLKFGNETLEYLVTNRDLIRLEPKVFIPTRYDYWIDDVNVLKGNGEYELEPNNPYETVINTRPAISFYNDNNPDWLNTMIFYHVLAHIDFFQNNKLFTKTWNDDFAGQALADKRLIAKLRSEKGRWVDYVIEFSRGLDNILGFFGELAENDFPANKKLSDKIEFYFNEFLQGKIKIPHHEFLKELERYNTIENESLRESIFFADIPKKYSEFASSFKKFQEEKQEKAKDILEFIILNSPKLKKEENKWMIPIMHIVRNTGLYFSPQMRDKIINEGWAAYWHDKLFRQDERMRTHEIEYAITNSGAVTIPRLGLNPYGIGKALIEHVEELAERGKMSLDFQRIRNIEAREEYNKKTGKGKEAIFRLRENFSDFTLINTFVDQDFVDKNNLFVSGQKLSSNPFEPVMEIYVKSKKAEDYKKVLLDSLYHPPSIQVEEEKTNYSVLYLVHNFEGKQLVKDFIPNVMIGTEFLYGAKVQLETTEVVEEDEDGDLFNESENSDELKWQRVRYTIENKKISKEILS